MSVLPRRCFNTAGALTVAALIIPSVLSAQQIDPARYGELHFRHIGPLGNRVSSVAGVPGDRFTYFAGAATGGIWKTEDAGLHWRPVFDDQPVHSIGALAVAPSDPNVVWAGTGETFIRSNVSIGNGVWKSTDGGETWQHVGLEGTGRIGRVVVHPTNPDIVYAAALGHAYSPQAERGVYRTTDGGQTWTRVLFVDENTGASDIAMDPHNPRILYAGMWQLELKTWTRQSGGPGSGLYMSRDAGDTWTRLEGSGLPTTPVGKIAVCLSADDSRRVYALIETGDGVPMNGEDTGNGELWRTEDGGETWDLVTYDHNLATRSAYYSRCAVAPDDRDEVYFLSSNFSRSLNGGETHESFNFLRNQRDSPGWDHHDMWIDPTNADRMIIGFDGGVALSENRGRSWFRVQLPIAQMYHVTADNAIPYNVLGNRQDGPSYRGPSNTRAEGYWATGMIPRGEWHAVGGGESGFATADPEDPNIIWSSASGSGARGGIVVRYNERTRQFRHVEVWPESTGGWPAEDLRYRFQWTFPLLISPHDNTTIYVTSQHVHRTSNGGQTWEVISPDLTTNDKSKQRISGGLTPDNIGVEYCCVIYAFDESPVQRGVLWAGSNDGLVHVSRDGGANWTNVTNNIPDLPPLGTVRSIDASKWSAGKAYITIEHHQVGDFTARAYKTENFGQRWTRITDGIDDGPVSYTRYLLEDPVRPGLLYLGTESTLYVSFDDGGRWQPFMNNLPHTPYYGLVVQEHFNDLVVGTYGRGFWILDDLSPIQQLTAEVAASDAHLFTPRAAYRFRPTTESVTMFEDPSVGENPPNGASINYWLGAVPDNEVTLRIDNDAGQTVRTLEGTQHVGINRVWWDFKGDSSTQIELRTKPLYADWMPLPETFRTSGPRVSITEPPGTYSVTLLVGDREFTQPLTVHKDPNSEGSLADIRAQVALARELRSDLDTTAKMINRIELVRRQLHDLKSIVSDREDAKVIVEATDELNQKLIDLESNLLQLKSTGRGDGVRWPAMLAQRIGYLAGTIQTADFPPTDAQREVHQALRERLVRYQGQFDELMSTDLPAFNRMLQERSVPPIIS
ncbi:MAG: sialidase [Gemmatimonadetes bacterium]|nr:sialidase [Gemmatimonadota bacterium]